LSYISRNLLQERFWIKWARPGTRDGRIDRNSTVLDITVRGSAEMIQDVVELITSVSVVLLCLEMVPVFSSNIATPPSRRFVDTVDSALSRWASTIAHVTLSVLPSVASKLPDEITEALVYLPQLEHLELNGWDVASNIANYFLGRLCISNFAI